MKTSLPALQGAIEKDGAARMFTLSLHLALKADDVLQGTAARSAAGDRP